MNVTEIWSELTVWVPRIVLAASAAAAVLPKPADGTTWATIRKVLDWAALNIGNSTNAK